MGEVVRPKFAKDRVIAHIGGPVDEAEPTLCIYGAALDPDTVSTLLACRPTRAHRKGDPRRGGVPARTGAWLLTGDSPSSVELDTQIRLLLGKLTVDLEVWREISRTCTIRMSCTLTLLDWSRGLQLTPDVLNLLASRCIELGFSIYYVGHEDV
jgi:hypothetical protein